MNKNLGDWAIGQNLYEWILSNIKKGSKVLELGSGSGTHEIGKLYDVHCIEHSDKWVNKYDNLTYYYAPIKDGWYDKDSIKNIPKDYDLLIFDGPPGNIGRTKVLENLHMFNLNVPIIIDDTHRDVEKNIAKELINKTGKKFVVIKEHNKSAYILIV